MSSRILHHPFHAEGRPDRVKSFASAYAAHVISPYSARSCDPGAPAGKGARAVRCGGADAWAERVHAGANGGIAGLWLLGLPPNAAAPGTQPMPGTPLSLPGFTVEDAWIDRWMAE